MTSIRSKVALLAVIAIVVTVAVTSVLSVGTIRRMGENDSEQLLRLLCETGQKNLDFYFESIEHSVGMVSTYAETDLETLPDEQLKEHVERVRRIFDKTATETNGVLTYYYRIDPSVTVEEKGFWYVEEEGKGFQEHEVTDISLYEGKDDPGMVWFTVPKTTGKPAWLNPYLTENLGRRVLSYNVPVFWKDKFFGVIGIEIDYTTIANQVDNIKLYEHGFAYLDDCDGNLIYHPNIDVPSLTDETRPSIPDGILSDDMYLRYTFEGVEKQAVRKELSNGMRLIVAVPVAEISGDWKGLVKTILWVSAGLVVVFILAAFLMAGRITRPIRELAEAAQKANDGNFDYVPKRIGRDEVGTLTQSFTDLTGYLKTHIRDLNNMAYADELTSVRNKGAFQVYIREMQEKIMDSDETAAYAIAIYDCIGLQKINDRFGKEKGGIYLKTACQMICNVFVHSPVFRVGDDEFAVILMKDDYRNRIELTSLLEERCEKTLSSKKEWERIRLSVGVAVYDPETDASVKNVVSRAEKNVKGNRQYKKGKK